MRQRSGSMLCRVPTYLSSIATQTHVQLVSLHGCNVQTRATPQYTNRECNPIEWITDSARNNKHMPQFCNECRSIHCFLDRIVFDPCLLSDNYWTMFDSITKFYRQRSTKLPIDAWVVYVCRCSFPFRFCLSSNLCFVPCDRKRVSNALRECRLS